MATIDTSRTQLAIERASAASSTRSRRFKRGRFLTLIYIVLVIILVVQFFPSIWALLTSLMTSQETTSVPATLVPAHPTLQSYSAAVQGDIGHYYINSIIAAIVSTIVTMLLATLAAYAFARLRFRFKTPLLLVVLVPSFFPPLAQVIPLYRILQSLHLIGTLGALILPYSVFGLPLAVLILMAFFNDIAQILRVQRQAGKIIAAALRHPVHVTAVAKAGAHIATMSFDILAQLIRHPLTDQGLAGFMADYERSQQR